AEDGIRDRNVTGVQTCALPICTYIKIGAGVRHAEIEDGTYPELRGHPLQKVAGRIAYRGVRNRGTISGSLVHADPAADWVVTLEIGRATGRGRGWRQRGGGGGR